MDSSREPLSMISNSPWKREARHLGSKNHKQAATDRKSQKSKRQRKKAKQRAPQHSPPSSSTVFKSLNTTDHSDHGNESDVSMLNLSGFENAILPESYPISNHNYADENDLSVSYSDLVAQRGNKGNQSPLLGVSPTKQATSPTKLQQVSPNILADTRSPFKFYSTRAVAAQKRSPTFATEGKQKGVKNALNLAQNLIEKNKALTSQLETSLKASTPTRKSLNIVKFKALETKNMLLEQDVMDLSARNQSLQSEVEQLRATLNGQQRELHDQQQCAGREGASKTRLMSTLETIQAQLTNEKSVREAAQKEIARLQGSALFLTKQKDEVLKRDSALSAELSAVKEQRDALLRLVDSIAREANLRIHEEKAAAVTAVEHLRLQYDALETENRLMGEALEQIQDDIEEDQLEREEKYDSLKVEHKAELKFIEKLHTKKIQSLRQDHERCRQASETERQSLLQELAEAREEMKTKSMSLQSEINDKTEQVLDKQKKMAKALQRIDQLDLQLKESQSRVTEAEMEHRHMLKDVFEAQARTLRTVEEKAAKKERSLIAEHRCKQTELASKFRVTIGSSIVDLREFLHEFSAGSAEMLARFRAEMTVLSSKVAQLQAEMVAREKQFQSRLNAVTEESKDARNSHATTTALLDDLRNEHANLKEMYFMSVRLALRLHSDSIGVVANQTIGSELYARAVNEDVKPSQFCTWLEEKLFPPGQRKVRIAVPAVRGASRRCSQSRQ